MRTMSNSRAVIQTGDTQRGHAGQVASGSLRNRRTHVCTCTRQLAVSAQCIGIDQDPWPFRAKSVLLGNA